MYRLIQRYLFTLDPEDTHEWTVKLLKFAQKVGGTRLLHSMYTSRDDRLSSEHWGLHFPNPIGLAAGFDKNAEVYKALAALGFGFVEVGTITPLPQAGNVKPRLFRLVADEAIINRMGFNNRGIQFASDRLLPYEDTPVPIGVNIGKNKDTPNDQAADDYEKCLEALYPYGDYFVINVSSPNTPNLRDLQASEDLRYLMGRIQSKKEQLEAKGMQRKPVLLKVAPDMSDEQMRDIVHIAATEGLSGIIATNTTLARDGLRSEHYVKEAGGLSGRPLTGRTTAWIKEIYQEVGDQLPIIGVGGIFTGEDAYEKIRAGASLVQVYTGLIYEGPNIVKRIQRRLSELMKRDGFTKVSEVVGVDK